MFVHGERESENDENARGHGTALAHRVGHAGAQGKETMSQRQFPGEHESGSRQDDRGERYRSAEARHIERMRQAGQAQIPEIVPSISVELSRDADTSPALSYSFLLLYDFSCLFGCWIEKLKPDSHATKGAERGARTKEALNSSLVECVFKKGAVGFVFCIKHILETDE